MRFLEWVDALGQSSLQIAFAQSVYQKMLGHQLSLAQEQFDKKLKAEAQIAETGKTKLDWDESVLKKRYVWSRDVLASEYSFETKWVVGQKEAEAKVRSALNYLEAKGSINCLLLSGKKRSQCYCVPLEEVLKHV